MPDTHLNLTQHDLFKPFSAIDTPSVPDSLDAYLPAKNAKNAKLCTTSVLMHNLMFGARLLI